MKEIPLTQGKVALVSDHQYERVSRLKWWATFTHGRWYARGTLNGTKILLHRFLTNAPPGMAVDHVNGDGLNCTDENIRVCTHAQNRQNSKKSAVNTSGFVGVSWHKAGKKWASEIWVDGERLYLGLYDNITDAALTRDAAAIKYHGEFARLNFPDGIERQPIALQDRLFLLE